MKAIYSAARPERSATGGTRYTAEILDYLTENGASVSFLQSEDSPRSFVKRSFLLSNFWYLWQFIRLKRSEDTVIIEDYTSRVHVFLANSFVRFSRKARLVSITQAFYFSYRKSFVKNLADRIVSILFFACMDLVITPSGAAAREAMRLRVSSSSTRIIKPALSTDFGSAVSMSPLRNGNQQTNLLFVGRFHPIKGLEYLLQAVKTLEDKNLILTVVGDVEQGYQPYVRRIRDEVATLGIESKVKFVGRKDGAALLEIYRSADIFVVPSLYESYPIVVMEAMSVGLPVVATQAGGIPELIEDGVNGILVSPGDSSGMAAAIRTLIEDHALRERMAQKSYERFLQFRHRTWKDVGRECHQVLSELLSE